ncbi:peptide ABC transporter substrate-binding protein [Streptomyces sp. 110]|uniref:Peptide ABC transporter substrate-binding protein n=1 Tax=Streptomyces endocoffeicus TaxID=2898945 RepID=A0ABS1Q559_9ACTN|nr:ABC transporter substrate-binding protein [Streptomyces endocoffeicus]MBL1119380.1 peptide ABC transporter substrate-binding protein [Streptomyces endocoffeicus]
MPQQFAATVHARRPARLPMIGTLFTALALTATACTSGGAVSPSETGKNKQVRGGGSLVIGAEQEPDCADWIGTCGASIWGTYMMQTQTIPQVFDVRLKGKNWTPVASSLMSAEPTVRLKGKRQQITYRLDPKAVWSDGKPITSGDLKYTALQVRDGKAIFDKSGYDRIASVETPDSTTAVVTLKSAYGNWKQLFSAGYGVLPSHILKGRNRNAVMKDGYTFSGGPWKIASWKKGVSVTLVPNDRYWGPKPHLDKVTFQFVSDTSAATQAFASGQFDALFPTPQLNTVEQIRALGGAARMQVESESGNLQALWLNNGRFPFSSAAVRRAFAYSIDRAAIVKRLFGSYGLKDPAQSFLSPLVSRYASTGFSRYRPDAAKAEQLMEADGWKKNAKGIWAKNGKKAEFTITSLAGNKSRELTEQILQSQLAKAGFKMTIKNTTPANIFGKLAPAGDFQVGLWNIVDSFPNPTLSASFSSTAIPSSANNQSGINFMRIRVQGLDPVMERVDNELNETARIRESRRAEKLIADSVPSLPLAAVPNVLVTGQRVGGPLSVNPVDGPWWNLEEWGVAK